MPGLDATLWERDYLRRYESIRASLRSLQLEADRDFLGKTSASYKRMIPYFKQVNQAFDVMNDKPASESAERRDPPWALQYRSNDQSTSSLVKYR